MNKYLVPALIFLGGTLCAGLIIHWQQRSSARSYLSSEGRSDLPAWDEKTKASLAYYFSSLPESIQNEIQKRDPNFERLTSCSGNIIPNADGAYAVSYVAAGVSKVFVFQVRSTGAIIQTFDLSKDIDHKISGDDSLEIQCRHGSYILSNSKFQLLSAAKDLALSYQASNASVLRVKTRLSQTYGVFAYDRNDQKFHQLGTVSQ